jgi:GNAT superfamily N-acetyltransferase
MNGNLRIRKASEQDIPHIYRLIVSGKPEGESTDSVPGQLPPKCYDAFRIIDSDKHQLLVVAELSGDIIGTMQMTFIHRLTGQGRADCVIESVRIDADYRNSGYGTQLMKWAIETAKNASCRKIELTSDLRRHDAHRFYEGLGFTFSHRGAKLWL